MLVLTYYALQDALEQTAFHSYTVSIPFHIRLHSIQHSIPIPYLSNNEQKASSPVLSVDGIGLFRIGIPGTREMDLERSVGDMHGSHFENFSLLRKWLNTMGTLPV